MFHRSSYEDAKILQNYPNGWWFYCTVTCHQIITYTRIWVLFKTFPSLKNIHTCSAWLWILPHAEFSSAHIFKHLDVCPLHGWGGGESKLLTFWPIWSHSQTPMPSRSLNLSQLRTNSVLNIRSWVGSDRLMQELQERQHTDSLLYIWWRHVAEPPQEESGGEISISLLVCVWNRFWHFYTGS